MKVQISHGGDPEEPSWFIVRPLPGETTGSIVGGRITNEMAVQGLLDAGRTVCEVEVEPWQGYSSGREARKARKREQEENHG